MSVEVKTPTKVQFEHSGFPCGEKQPGPKHKSSDEQHGDIPHSGIGDGEENRHSEFQNVHIGLNSRPPAGQGRGGIRKRRYSERTSENRPHVSQTFKKKFGRHGSRPEKIVLPTKFLLGGNINDPLNLNSMCDEEINKAMNERTPVSSPLPPPVRRSEVHVIIPPNINDPLNLNSGEDFDPSLISPKTVNKRKRHKNRYKKKSMSGDAGDSADETVDAEPNIVEPEKTVTDAAPAEKETDSTTLGNKMRKVIDKIVSPVIPQSVPKIKKRKRTSSETKVDIPLVPVSGPKTPTEEEVDTSKQITDKQSPFHKHRNKRQPSTQNTPAAKAKTGNANKKQNKFIYGNYNRYYGYRNPCDELDDRLKCFQLEWFNGKDVLDLGCNVGHVTLAVARDFHPLSIVGIDIDPQLIKAARKNIRHYLSSNVTDVARFPSSMQQCYGPISGPPGPAKSNVLDFPNNVAFLQGNYVLERDELLMLQREEYDVVMALSLTKWIHLNFGDDGLKRTFKRIFRQLRPGGRLILEPQSWASYKKKKKLTDTIWKNYQSITFRPEQFTEYLLSREVGFSTCEKVDTPFNRSKGFQRAIQVFIKPSTTQPTPRGDSRFNTPQFTVESPANFTLGSASNTPQDTPEHFAHFNIGSTSATPSAVSPLSQDKVTDKTSVTDSPLESTKLEPRPLGELKIGSAPCLLESGPYQPRCEIEKRLLDPEHSVSDTIRALPYCARKRDSSFIEEDACPSEKNEMPAKTVKMDDNVETKDESQTGSSLCS